MYQEIELKRSYAQTQVIRFFSFRQKPTKIIAIETKTFVIRLYYSSLNHNDDKGEINPSCFCGVNC